MVDRWRIIRNNWIKLAVALTFAVVSLVLEITGAVTHDMWKIWVGLMLACPATVILVFGKLP